MILLLAAVGVVSLVFYHFQIPCVYQRWLHIPCPGCGMTRAVICLLQLRWKDAFFYHPMCFTLPLVFVYIVMDGKVFRNRMLDRIVLIALGIGFAAAYAAKLCFLYMG